MSECVDGMARLRAIVWLQAGMLVSANSDSQNLPALLEVMSHRRGLDASYLANRPAWRVQGKNAVLINGGMSPNE